MATLNFNRMATRKLNALLETASEEDKVKIEQVLAERKQQAQSPAGIPQAEEAQNLVEEMQSPAEQEELTPEEQAIIAEAEKNGGVNPMYEKREAELKKATDEELQALANELKANVNHKCQVVPFNTIEWVDGYIAGVIVEKRSRKVMYAVKTVDGRRIVKVHDSKLIKVLDEVVNDTQRTASTRKANTAKVEWTPEVMNEEIEKVLPNVGRLVTFRRTGEAHSDEEFMGRIVAITPDKRVSRLLYRIQVAAPTEEDPEATKIMHKVSTSKEIEIAEDYDEIGAELNKKYIERREGGLQRTALTPQEKVVLYEANLKKAEEKLAQVQAQVEAKRQQLEEAKAELQKFLDGQAEEPLNGQAAEEVDELA